MKAFAAARLAERRQAEFLEQRTRQLRGLDHTAPAERRVRVEVEYDAIGLLDARRNRVPRMQFDRAHLRGADERLHAFDRDQRRMIRVETGMLRYVRNPQLLAVLLEEQLAADVLGRALQAHTSLP